MRLKKLVKIFLGIVILGILLLWWKSEKITTLEKEIIQPEKIFFQPEVYLSSESLKQGSVFLIKIKSQTPLNEVKGSLNSENLNFFEWTGKNNLMAIVGISPKENPGKYNLVINFPSGQVFEKELNVIERKFTIEKLLLSDALKKEGYTEKTLIEEIIKKEKLVLDEIFEIFTEKIYFEKPFIYPLKDVKVVGDFGSIRKNEDSAIQHLGVDLKADANTPVYAVNDGIVRFSQNSKINGKTLIIDHGFGIFSFYCHLNEFRVLEGKEVKRGELIGLSGNTGYTLGPHLHFSIKINEKSVDPLKFIELTQKEFE